MLEAETDRALVDAGRRLVVVADHSKWGVIGVSTIARFAQANLLISDPGLSESARAVLSEQVQELYIAGETGRGDNVLPWRGDSSNGEPL